MRRLATASSLMVLGVLGALLSGCPVWGDGPGGRPGSDGGVGPRACNTNDQCATNQYCNTTTHECVTTPTCTSGTAGCPGGYFCDSRNACIPGCSSNTDCARLGAGLTCNATTRQCEATGCTSDSQCMNNELCVSGGCRPATSVCQFNYQCNAGQECVDGRCLAQCTTTGSASCPSGQVCTAGHCQAAPPTGTCECSPTQVCSQNQCLGTCHADGDCGAGNFCNNGVCRIDDRRPVPFCTVDSMCATGSVCRNGVCRLSCPTGTNNECMLRDVNFPLCGTDHLCTSSTEQNPQCLHSSQCATGQTCINATCR